MKRVYYLMSYLLLGITLIFLMFPVFLLVTSSFKTMSEYSAYPVKIYPETLQWSNYLVILGYFDFGEIATRTGLLALGYAGITSFTSALIGFGFARYAVPGSHKLFLIVISLLIIPQIVVIIPQFIMYARMQMINTYWPWILSALAGSPLYIFLYRQFFLGFPKELEDAAEVDGCGALRIFFYIFLPNSKPVIATVAIFAFMSVWGDYFTPLIFLNANKTLLGVALASFWGRSTYLLAGTVLYILPVVIFFAFAQKHILEGVVTSGLKG